MTSTPPLKCCEKCSIEAWNSCGNSDCPCHTPPVEGEWEKEFDRIAFTTLGTSELIDKRNIKPFITTLLHSEREKGWEAEGMARIDGRREGRAEERSKAWESKAVQEAYEQGKSHARAEERERIVKMIDGMMKESKIVETSEYYAGYNSAILSLRDKLSNK